MFLKKKGRCNQKTGIRIVFTSMKIQGEMHGRMVLIDYSVYQRKDEFHVSLTKASNYQIEMPESLDRCLFCKKRILYQWLEEYIQL